MALALGVAIGRDWYRGALIATVLVIGFFGYGHAWNAAVGVLDNQWPLIGAWALLVAIGLFVAWRFGRGARTATRALNLVAAIALLLNAWSLAGTMVTVASAGTSSEDVSPLELHPPDPEDLPDVYYVILDRYAGPTALAETYDFDNEPFLTALEERGFAVARHAHANYIKTPLSLVSSLNMELLDAEAAEGGGRVRGRSRADPTPPRPSPRGADRAQGARLPVHPRVELVAAVDHERRRRPHLPLRRPGRVLNGAGPDHAPAGIHGARGGADRSVGLARAARAFPLRARSARRDPRAARPQVRLRAHPSPARPVRLRQRWLVHGSRAGRRAGPAGELPAPAELPERPHAPAWSTASSRARARTP